MLNVSWKTELKGVMVEGAAETTFMRYSDAFLWLLWDETAQWPPLGSYIKKWRNSESAESLN